jgi:hypothetical protein
MPTYDSISFIQIKLLCQHYYLLFSLQLNITFIGLYHYTNLNRHTLNGSSVLSEGGLHLGIKKKNKDI